MEIVVAAHADEKRVMPAFIRIIRQERNRRDCDIPLLFRKNHPRRFTDKCNGLRGALVPHTRRHIIQYFNEGLILGPELRLNDFDVSRSRLALSDFDLKRRY